MKRISTKTLSVFLSVLMLITSIPFAAIAATPLNEANAAISAYETKMDGTVFTNMQAAFDAYVKTKQDVYAYEVGGKTDVDLSGDAEALNTATAAMTAWTSPKGTAQASFADDTGEAEEIAAAYENYNKNILYTETVATVDDAVPAMKSTKDDNSAQRMAVSVYYPTTVLLYDGETTPTMPVMARATVDSDTWTTTGYYRYVYALFPLMNSDDDTKSDFRMKNSLWNGSNGEDVNRNLNFPWTLTQTDGRPAANISDIAQNNSLFISRNKTLGVYVNYYWCAMANAMEYKAGAKGFSDDEYYTQNYITWRRYSGDELSKNSTPWPSDTLDKQATTPVYVINYAPLKTAVNSAVSVVASNPSSYLIDHTKASNMLAAVDSATAFDPNDNFNNTDSVKNNVVFCADTIKSLIADLDDEIPTPRLNADYVNLKNAVETSKETYDGANADGKYTAESYAVFKTAYEAGIAAAQAVAANGFTSTTTGNELSAAYAALNVQAFDTGTAGNTEYDFDETTGTLSITPTDGTDGKMADYDKAEDSPFGNNESITEVVIDPDVTYIGAYTFDGASNLTTITVPAGATYGEGAFDNCPKLKTVIIVGGDVQNESAVNAPWQLDTVNIIKLGTDLNDKSVTSVGDGVFTDKANTAFYVYNENCIIPGAHNNTFGTNPTIHGSNPSTAYTYNQTYPEPITTFVQINHGEHIWGLKDRVAPACEKQGYDLYECSVCGETKKENEAGPIGHDWDAGTVTSPATCTTAGTIVYTCKNDASHKHIESISATGHDWEITETTATCTTSGVTTYTCKNDANHTKTEFSAPLGHDYVATVVPATCSDLGYTEYVCSRCGDSYKADYTPANNNHTWDDGVVTKAATCTTRGEIKHTCLNDASHTYIEYVDALGHDWDAGVVTKEATVEETGVLTLTCKHDSSHKMTVTIPKVKTAPVPSAKEADSAPVNKSIKKINSINTVSNAKKKTMTVTFSKVSGAQNYRVAFRKAGAKNWTYYWTGGKSTYVFKKLKASGLYEFKFAAYKKVNGKWQRGDWSTTSYRYYKKETIKKISSKNKSISLSWNRDKNANYYVIFYSTNKNMKGQKKITVKGNKKTSYTIKKLKKGKKYYVRVRAYKTKNKKDYAGELSAKKSIKVK